MDSFPFFICPGYIAPKSAKKKPFQCSFPVGHHLTFRLREIRDQNWSLILIIKVLNC